jgi:hypothetical protein
MIYKIPIITVEKTWNTAFVPIEAGSLDEAKELLESNSALVCDADEWKLQMSETIEWEIDEDKLKQETVE